MANRLQRVMMMDQMFQNRNMPQTGVQSVFNPTTRTFVNIPFQTDPNFPGRRIVMTRTGPQALPGFQGQENPYRALGRTARNLLGNLFSRGQRRRQNRKADQSLQSQEEILRERYRQAGPDGQMNTDDDILPEFVTKAPTASPVVVKDGKGEITFTQERFPGVFEEAGSYENRIKQLMENQVISREEAERRQAEAIRRGMDLDNSGYVDDSEEFAFNNPMTAGQPLEIPAFRSGREERLREIEERINRPIVTSQNLPTFDVSQVRTPSTSEFNRKTTSFADGSALLIDTKGNAQLLTKDGSVISNIDQTGKTNPEYARLLKEAIASGVLYESTVARARAEGKENVSQMDEASNKIDAANANILVLDEALAALDSGAGTGPIANMLPTIRSSSLRLREAQRKLGLNVVSETTFGALSAPELRLALETGLDLNLPEDQLREVIVKRKAAQEKLIDYFYEALDFLDSSETNTIAKFKLKKKQEQKAREKAQQNGGATTPPSSDEDEQYEVRTPEGEIIR